MTVPDADFAPQVAAERWCLALAAELPPLLKRHPMDRRGRCRVCRSVPRWWWPWPKRAACTVRSELVLSLQHLDRVVLGIITVHNSAIAVGGRSWVTSA